MLPTANALCALLRDLLEDAASANSLQARTRTALYTTVRACAHTFGLSAAEALAPALAACAWAEFYRQAKGTSFIPADFANGTGRKKAKKNGTDTAIDSEPAEAVVMQHAQRSAALQDTVDAQVRVAHPLSFMLYTQQAFLWQRRTWPLDVAMHGSLHDAPGGGGRGSSAAAVCGPSSGARASCHEAPVSRLALIHMVVFQSLCQVQIPNIHSASANNWAVCRWRA